MNFESILKDVNEIVLSGLENFYNEHKHYKDFYENVINSSAIQNEIQFLFNKELIGEKKQTIDLTEEEVKSNVLDKKCSEPVMNIKLEPTIQTSSNNTTKISDENSFLLTTQRLCQIEEQLKQLQNYVHHNDFIKKIAVDSLNVVKEESVISSEHSLNVVKAEESESEEEVETELKDEEESESEEEVETELKDEEESESEELESESEEVETELKDEEDLESEEVETELKDEEDLESESEEVETETEESESEEEDEDEFVEFEYKGKSYATEDMSSGKIYGYDEKGDVNLTIELGYLENGKPKLYKK